MTRTLFALAATFTVVGSRPLLAQRPDLYARLGAVYSSELVTDAVAGAAVTELKPDIAPALTLGAAMPIAPAYDIGIEVMLARGGMTADESGGTSNDVGNLLTATTVFTLAGPAYKRLRWRATIGLISYLPSEDEGIFLQGGTTRLLTGAQLEYRRPAFGGWDLTIAGGADFHKFTTDELQARGFGGTQGVVRGMLTIGIARGRP